MTLLYGKEIPPSLGLSEEEEQALVDLVVFSAKFPDTDVVRTAGRAFEKIVGHAPNTYSMLVDAFEEGWRQGQESGCAHGDIEERFAHACEYAGANEVCE